jgi:Flp pilus assembly pilin Flp
MIVRQSPPFEYTLIAGVILATIRFGFTLLASDISQQFQNVRNSATNGQGDLWPQ